MTLTVQQVLEMAPDPSAAAAGKKLAAVKNWSTLGRSDEAYWGLCQGSAVYQVKIDLSNYGYHCSCPSRKFPCKHSLGLLLIAAESESSLKPGEMPEWVRDWLARRQARSEKKAEKAAATETKPVDEKAQAKRIEQRESRIREGLDRIELWMTDRIREGLAGLETQPPTIWAEQSKRLVDAQAPAVAATVSQWSEIVGSGTDWPRRLLAEFGRLQLLIHAYRRLDQLDVTLQSDVRQLIGWNTSQDEIDRVGERVDDSWVVIGQRTDDVDRLRVQRSWLIGRKSGDTAAVLQFSAGGQPFSESIAAGTEQNGTIAFYPGAARQRAKFVSRSGVTATHSLPGGTTFELLLDDVATRLGKQPWMTLFGYVVDAATFVPRDDMWMLRDSAGRSLPLVRGSYWKALALSGGAPCDVAVEWNGEALRPLGMIAGDSFRGL